VLSSFVFQPGTTVVFKTPLKSVISTDQREWRNLSISKVPVLSKKPGAPPLANTISRQPQSIFLQPTDILQQTSQNADVSPLSLAGRNDPVRKQSLPET
jgi:hypothetical protein